MEEYDEAYSLYCRLFRAQQSLFDYAPYILFASVHQTAYQLSVVFFNGILFRITESTRQSYICLVLKPKFAIG